MTEDDDGTLVDRCRSGDRAAFAALVTRYQRALYNAAYRLLGNADDANDIAQTVFLRVLERLDEFDANYRFFSWIYRIAVNESISLLRHRKHEEPIDDEFDPPGPEGESPASSLQQRQLSDHVQQVLMRVKHEDRVVLTLRHFAECSYREIAEILLIDEKTVKSRLFEARQRLATLLNGEFRN